MKQHIKRTEKHFVASVRRKAWSFKCCPYKILFFNWLISIIHFNFNMSFVESRRINVKAPVRFDFAGGPTDVEPFRSRENGFV